MSCSSQFTALRNSGADRKCVSEPYTAGDVCRQALATTQGCALGYNFEEVLINAAGSQTIKSKNLTSFLNVIGKTDIHKQSTC